MAKTKRRRARGRARAGERRAELAKLAADQVLECYRAPCRTYIQEGEGGRRYLPAWYIRTELGRIFRGRWSYQIQVLERTARTVLGRGPGPKLVRVCYAAIVRLSVVYADGRTQAFDGDGDGFEEADDEGAADAGARKSAVGDALKRAAINLGTAFGLGLYDDANPIRDGGPDHWAALEGEPAEGRPPAAEGRPTVAELRLAIAAAMRRPSEPWAEDQVAQVLERYADGGGGAAGTVKASNVTRASSRAALVLTFAGCPPERAGAFRPGPMARPERAAAGAQ